LRFNDVNVARALKERLEESYQLRNQGLLRKS